MSQIPTDYRQPQSTLIYELIEESNPGFGAAFPPGSIKFSNVTSMTADVNGNDTTVAVTPAAGSSDIGRVIVKYRRLDFAKLFKNVKVTLEDYVASGTLPATTWKASFVSKYGPSMLSTDWNISTALTSGVAATVGPISSCLCFKGTVSLTWTAGKRPLHEVITNANRALPGRLYPGGNDFSVGRKPTGEFQLYAQDASSISATLEGFSAITNVPADASGAAYTTLLNWLNSSSGKTDWSTADSVVQGGLGGIAWYRYTLPNASAPDANSAKFNRVMVFQGLAGSWFSGKILLHYNV